MPSLASTMDDGGFDAAHEPYDAGADAALDAGGAVRTLNTPDDLVVRSDGTIYFTDPSFTHGPFEATEVTRAPIYRIAPVSSGAAIVEEATLYGANGIELSPDERTLYVSGYFGGRIVAYDVQPSGALGPERTLARGLRNPDSFCLDIRGNLYVGVKQGLAVLRPDGSAVTTIPVPSERGVTNCEFGGADGRTLYITAWTSLFRIDDMPHPGLQWERSQGIECVGREQPPRVVPLQVEPTVEAGIDDPLRRIGEVVLVADGFELAEGPLWDPCSESLLFTDVDRERIHVLVPPSKVEVLEEASNFANGLAFDRHGRLLRAEMGGGRLGRVTRTDRTGFKTVLAGDLARL